MKTSQQDDGRDARRYFIAARTRTYGAEVFMGFSSCSETMLSSDR
jgi:hypothetical protein